MESKVFKDFLGNEVYLGDRVVTVFFNTNIPLSEMCEGIVVEINDAYCVLQTNFGKYMRSKKQIFLLKDEKKALDKPIDIHQILGKIGCVWGDFYGFKHAWERDGKVFVMCKNDPQTIKKHLDNKRLLNYTIVPSNPDFVLYTFEG